MMHAPCTSKAPHAPHVWGDSGPAWGGGSPDTWECPGIPTEQFGATETYPSKAAGYGAEGLMAMAGTLAEPAEQAQVATAYAVLALAQAVRDLPKEAARVVDGPLPDDQAAVDMTGLVGDLRLVLPRVTDQITLTPAERAAATRLGLLADG